MAKVFLFPSRSIKYILPESISVSIKSYSGCLTHQVQSIVLSCSLCTNRESNLDFRAVRGRGEAQGKREMSILGVRGEQRLEREGVPECQKRSKVRKACRRKGMKCRNTGRIKVGGREAAQQRTPREL